MSVGGGRGFRRWLAASTASVFGDSVTFFALGWAAAGFGADAASLVLTIEGIPLAVLVLAGGVLADRIGIRPVLLATPLIGLAAGVDVRLALGIVGALLLAAVGAAVRVVRLARAPQPIPLWV